MLSLIISVILFIISLFAQILCTPGVTGGNKITQTIWFNPKIFVKGKWRISSDEKTWHEINCNTWKQWSDMIESFKDSPELYFTDGAQIMKWRAWDKLPENDPKTDYLRKYRVDSETLKGVNAFLMTPFLRSWQYEHILRYISHRANLFDIGIGTGRSRDLWRARHARVWGVEPDFENFKFLVKRKIPELQHVQNWGGETQQILNWIPSSSMDAVMMSYSITFFFRDRDMLHALLTNVRHALRTGGVFILIGMDGKVVDKWFTKSPVLDNECFSIKKSYKKRESFGSEIEITIKNPVSLVENQTEYLVDFDILKSHLKKDFTLVRDEHVRPPFYLSEWPAKFVTAQRLLVFRKIY